MVGLIDICCVVYLDDIFIYSANSADYQQHVREVLERLRNFKLYLKLSKYKFSIDRVELPPAGSAIIRDIAYRYDIAAKSISYRRIDTSIDSASLRGFPAY